MSNRIKDAMKQLLAEDADEEDVGKAMASKPQLQNPNSYRAAHPGAFKTTKDGGPGSGPKPGGRSSYDPDAAARQQSQLKAKSKRDRIEAAVKAYKEKNYISEHKELPAHVMRDIYLEHG